MNTRHVLVRRCGISQVRRPVRWPMWLSMWLALAVFVASVVGCGGGGSSTPPPGSAMIGPAGGTVMLAGGAQVVIPAGALAANTPIAIEASNAGAPALPPGFGAAAAMFAFTPHGTAFSAPVTVSIPVDLAAVLAGTTPTLYKTNAAGTWQRVPGAVLSGALVTAQVTGFSSFIFGAAPPFIAASQQPQDSTVAAGSTATFSVTALGAPPFTYQWQRSTDAGATFSDVAGATDRTHTTAATVNADTGARYRVIVSNPDGATTSQAAMLTVTPAVIAPPGNGAAGAVLAAGDAFSVALLADGTLRSWGFGALGRLGDGSAGSTGRASPGPVINLGDIVAIDAGGGSTLALRRNGEVWGWGNNAYGQLGGGSTGVAATPTRFIGTAALRGVRAVSMSALHSLVLRDDGRIEAAGSNRFGELGNAAVLQSTSTAVEVTLSPGMKPIVAIAAGDGFSVALDEDGGVWTWGTMFGGPLGNVVISARSDAPQRVLGIDPVQRIAAGPSHVLAVGRDGQLWSWGNNYSFGMLGRGDVGDFDAAPGRITLAGPIVAIAAGTLYSLALHADGSVFTWGSNTYGELGSGSLAPTARNTPGLALSLPGGIKAIAAGALGHALALGPDGRVWAWGFNAYGQLGDGTAVDRPTPVVIPGLNLN